MPDKTTKLLLAAIAAGLWVNIIVSLRPIEAIAQYEADQILKVMNVRLSNMDTNLDKLQSGACSNAKICR